MFKKFQSQFEKIQEKGELTWQEVERRLSANDGHYLTLATDMAGGGVLFGVDQDDNPLVADAGVEPIMCGMNYADTRKAVMFTEGEEGKRVPTGYELFPYARDYDKSPEILAYEAATGEPFVASQDQQEWRASWLESGERPDWPGYVDFDPVDGDADVLCDYPQLSDPGRGVRRLLRVKA